MIRPFIRTMSTTRSARSIRWPQPRRRFKVWPWSGTDWSGQHASAVVGTPFADGRWALLHRRPEDTAAGLEEQVPGDGTAWLELYEGWRALREQVIGMLLTPFPPVRHALGASLRLPRNGGLATVRMLLAPLRSLAEQSFRGDAAKLLLGGNAAHADIPLDAPGSGMMGWLLAMLGQDVGFPVPRGGAGMLTAALADRLEEAGGRIVVDARVTTVSVEQGRATGVRLEDGSWNPADVVLADVSAPALYGGLVSWEHLPRRTRERMSRFEWDPATVKVDWALSRPVPWIAAPERPPGTVHVAASLDEIATAGAQIANGEVPALPFLLVGQMATTDPDRAPAGAESLWAYTHVPQKVHRDAGGEGIRGVWDRDESEVMADRMQRQIERYAPGFPTGWRRATSRKRSTCLVTASRTTGGQQLQTIWRLRSSATTVAMARLITARVRRTAWNGYHYV